MSSESKSEPSSSRVRSNNFNKTKNSGNTVGAFEPPIPPVVADLRPWGAEPYSADFTDCVKKPR